MNLSIFATNLIAHEFFHFLVASFIGFFIFKHFRSLKLVVVIFLVTFLIDLDHLTEVFLVHGLNFSWFFASFGGNLFRESGKMTIFFHSWEILPMILFLGRRFQRWPLAMAIVLAATGHYLVDQLVYTSLYSMSLWEYSLIYRAWHRFNFWELCGGC